MDTIVFLGQIYPCGFCVAGQFGRPFTIKEIKKELSVLAKIDAASEVRLECTVDRFEDKHFVFYKNKAETFLNAIVNASAFAKGVSLTYVFHRLVMPDGRQLQPVSLNPALASLCTAYSIDDPTNKRLEDTVTLLARFPRIAIALDEIAGHKSDPIKVTVDCARAIEGLRSEIATTGTHENQQWSKFRLVLNLDRSYLDFIMDHAKEHRHGHRVSKSGADLEDVLKHSWVIMNRFLEYKLRGNHPLPVAEFPVLT